MASRPQAANFTQLRRAFTERATAIHLPAMRWSLGSVGAIALWSCLGAHGCVGEREFPQPAQMCENLQQACGAPILLEQQDSLFRECHAIGVEGVKDQTHEAQCFAFYDLCISECEFWSDRYSREAGTDAGEDAATQFDAQVGEPDATVSRDE